MDSHRRRILSLVLLAGLVLVAYANSFQGGFPFDNQGVILDDQRVQAVTAGNLRLILHQDYWGEHSGTGLYRPVTTLSFLFNYAILGNAGRPLGYHVINYLLHVANAYLVYLLAFFLLESFWQAFFTAALWALHPVLTESVTNIVGRADELAALTVLGALLLYIRSTGVQGRRKLPYLLGMMLLTAVGVFSKESAVVVAAFVVLYDFTYRFRGDEKKGTDGSVHTADRFVCPLFSLFSYGALALPLVAMWYVRSVVFARTSAPVFPFLENPLVGVDLATAKLTAIKVLGKYLWLLVWPRHLSADYSYNQIPLVDSHLARWEDWKAFAALAVLLGIGIVASALYRRSKAVFFFIGLSLLALLPTANLFVPIGTIMAERFLYLPAIGFAGCLVVAVYAAGRRLSLRPWAAPAVLCAIGAAFGIRTLLRNPDWKNNETLWGRAVEVCPESYKTHYDLAHAWFEKDPSQVDKSIARMERALAIVAPLPDNLNSTPVFQELGAYYGYKGDLAVHTSRSESLEWYRKALQILLRGVAIDNQFNAACRRRESAHGKRPEEIGVFGSESLYQNLGMAYTRLGDREQAERAFRYQQKLTRQEPGVRSQGSGRR